MTKVTKKTISSLKDYFLLAMPGLNDPNFSQSVVYICEHNADGAMAEKIVETVRGMLDREPDTDSATLAERVQEHFGVSVHPRSIERALVRQEKKRRP